MPANSRWDLIQRLKGEIHHGGYRAKVRLSVVRQVFCSTYYLELVGGGETAVTYDWLSPEARRLNYFVNQLEGNTQDKGGKPEIKERVYIRLV